MRNAAVMALAFAASLMTGGCASLVHGPTQTVNIVTEPSGAECAVGQFKVTSPAIVTLERSYSSPSAETSGTSGTTYYYPAGNSNIAVSSPAPRASTASSVDGYPVQCRLPGYKTAEGVLTVSPDWAFVAADVFFGGAVAGLLVDYAFGSSGYYLSPDVLMLRLTPEAPAPAAGAR